MLLFQIAPVARAAAQAVDQSSCVAAHAEAQVQQRRGALLAAREQLLFCAQKGCPKPILADCAGWLSEVEQSLSSVVFAISDEQGHDLTDVHVTANGNSLASKTDGRALPIDPGIYQLRFEANGFIASEQSISVRQSEKNRIVRVQMRRDLASVQKPVMVLDETSLKRPSHAERDAPRGHKPIPVASYIFGGVAVVGVGMFTYFGLSELSEVKEKEALDVSNAERERQGLPIEECAELCERGRRDFILTYVGLGVAVAGAAGAVIAYVVSDPQPAEPSSGRLRLGVTPLAAQRGAVLSVSGAF